jgi:hypothetical protein
MQKRTKNRIPKMASLEPENKKRKVDRQLTVEYLPLKGMQSEASKLKTTPEVLERIKSIARLMNNKAATEAEAEHCARALTMMLRKHSLDRATINKLLLPSECEELACDIGRYQVKLPTILLPRWVSTMSVSVLHLFSGVKSYISRTNSYTAVVFYGANDNAFSAANLFVELYASAHDMFHAFLKTNDKGLKGDTVVRTSYYAGLMREYNILCAKVKKNRDEHIAMCKKKIDDKKRREEFYKAYTTNCTCNHDSNDVNDDEVKATKAAFADVPLPPSDDGDDADEENECRALIARAETDETCIAEATARLGFIMGKSKSYRNTLKINEDAKMAGKQDAKKMSFGLVIQ